MTVALSLAALPVAGAAASVAQEAGAAEEQAADKAAAFRRHRVEKMTATLVTKGMQRSLAQKYAYAALAAEERGDGRAEELLQTIVETVSPAEMEALMSDEELADLLLSEVRSMSLSEKWTAFVKKVRQNWGNADTRSFAYASPGGGSRASRPVAEKSPAVWWLENYSGSIMQVEPSSTLFTPPSAPAGNRNVSVKKPDPDTEEAEPQKVAAADLLARTEEEQAATFAVASPQMAASVPATMASAGGFGGGYGAVSYAPTAGNDRGLSDETIVWSGDVSKLKDGEDALFDKTCTALDVKLTDEWRPWSIMVDDTGVKMTKRGDAYGNVGYAFTGEGHIADYVDEDGNSHATDIVKKGPGILVLDNAKNSYSGGTDVQGGIVYAADQGVLGTGKVTLHDDTALWVNYTWNNDYSSSFRNPVVSNAIVLTDGASAMVSYGDFIFHKVLGNNTSRIWRNMYLTGGLSGDEESTLALQGYTSRITNTGVFSMERLHLGGAAQQVRNQVWNSGFVLNRAGATDDARFHGTLTLLNHTNDSTHAESSVDDRLNNRNTGAVKLMLSDDVLEFATLDATRDFAWMKDNSIGSAYTELALYGTINGAEAQDYNCTLSDAVLKAYAAAGGTKENFKDYGLRQTYTNTITVDGTTKIGELKADLLGVTQDTYLDFVNYTESKEVKTVRVITQENDAHLVLGKEGVGARESWYSGTVGLSNQLIDPNADGADYITKADVEADADVTGTSVAGLSLTKVGNNAQYIHTAEVNNLNLQGGTLGFNNVKLVSNLMLESGTKLRLGVQDGVWTNEGSVHLTVGEDTTSAHRLSVITTEADMDGAPYSARVEGSLNMNTTTEMIFEVSTLGQDTGERVVIIPASVKEEELSTIKDRTDYLSSHSLLQVTAATGRAEGLDNGGVLTLGNSTPLSISGINFLREDYTDKVYFLAAADNISVADGSGAHTASDFSDRVLTLGYGFYGIVSSIDGHGYYQGDNYVTYGTDDANYLGQDYLVMRVAADPTRSWTGAGDSAHTDASNIWKASDDKTYDDYLKGLGTEADVQWKENRAYTDGVSVKFGNLWMPAAWEEFLDSHPGATVADFDALLTSNIVTKVGDELFSDAALPEGTERTSNGVAVTFGGVTYGEDGSYYDAARAEGPSKHYEQVVIDGTVSPGYVTVNSDFNLKQEDGTYVTVKDDTNYVFSGTGCIADATTERMNEIYGNLLSDETDISVLDDWKTGLAKGGTGTLVIQTENTYSGGSLLRGGLTVMQNQWALGKNGDVGGNIEMSYGAGLMVDYYDTNMAGGLGYVGASPTGRLTNNLLITHMADFDNTGATGDAQLFNNADAVTLVARLSSYDDAILTLRGASYSEEDAIAKFGKPLHTYAAYIFQDPVEAYGTIRMAGYLQGDDGRLVDENGQSYVHSGGNVQLTVVGHNTAIKPEEARWKNTTLDLSLNGSAHNVVALGSAFENGQPNTAGVNHYIYIGTIKDNGDVRDEDGNICAAVVSDASAATFGSSMDPTKKFIVNLTLEPAGDAHFNGNMGFGQVQNNVGEPVDSRGYVSLTKVGSASQNIGNARLYDLSVKDTGLLHVEGSLSVHSITTEAVGAQHIHVGEVADAAASHTLIVGNNGVLSFDATTLTGGDPLANIKGTESDTKYGSELSYVLLDNGSTVTASGNWKTGKGIAVMGNAEITFNTHDYSMDSSVTSDMDTTYTVDANLQNAFDSSHIIQMTTALSGTGVTLNLVNEQMSAGATEAERGTATANGYFVTHDLNAYNSSSGKVQYGLQGGSTVNIGSKTILQSTASAKTDSGIAYNVTGTDAALQFLENGTSGYSSYVHEATLAEGGRILFGGASVATSANNVNTDKVATDITKGTDVIITNKEGGEATVQNVVHTTANTTVDGVTYETTIGGTAAVRASVDGAVLTAQQESAPNRTLVQNTDFTDTMLSLQEKCSVSLENVVIAKDSQVQGAGKESGNMGADALAQGATAASDQSGTALTPAFNIGSVTLTDDQTRVNATLAQVENVVLGKGMVQVARAEQLAQTDVGGKGLTLGLTQESLQKAAAAGARYLAIQVSNSGRFLYEQEAVLESVKLTDHNGVTYTNPAYDYKVVSSAKVAEDLGVEKSQVSDTLLYIEVSAEYTPEPTTTALSLFAMAALAFRRKRK